MRMERNHVNIHIFYLFPLLLLVPQSFTIAKKNNVIKTLKELQGPRAIPCPVCPNFVCPGCPGSNTGGTGGTGATGATGICPEGAGGQITDFGSCLRVLSNGIISGTVNADCKEVFNDIVVSLSADIKDDLRVGADARILGDVCVGEDINVNQDATLVGDTFINGLLTVNNGAIISDSLVENGNQVVNGSLLITDNQTIDGQLMVQGNAQFNGLLTATGGMAVLNGAQINGGLEIFNTGCTGCTGIFINGDACIVGDEQLVGNKFVDELTVDQLATFNNLTIGTSGTTGPATFITNGVVTLNNGLTVAGGNHIINTANLQLDTGNLVVTAGSSTFNGPITANNGGFIQGGFVSNDDVTIESGDFNVTLGNATVAGDLQVNGSITGLGQATLASLTLTDEINSQGPTGVGTLIVNGGAGIGRDLWLGGCQYFANVFTNTGVTGPAGIPSCFNYYEETCFATTFIWGGIPTSPGQSVLIKAIRVGNIVNLLIPPIIINNPGRHIDVVYSFSPLPPRLRPFTTVRGASSTIIYNNPDGNPFTPDIFGELGEYNVSPEGIITFGLPGSALGPQRIDSTDFVMVDANTITYNRNSCNRNCKLPSTI